MFHWHKNPAKSIQPLELVVTLCRTSMPQGLERGNTSNRSTNSWGDRAPSWSLSCLWKREVKKLDANTRQLNRSARLQRELRLHKIGSERQIVGVSKAAQNSPRSLDAPTLVEQIFQIHKTWFGDALVT